ncbi:MULTISPECIES: hypothetical protein [Glycomyces]|uniref:Uncharacterized protein n=2 Tax=Glycomyces TaxID=58113 RepID=A0A9X3SWB5_9ACTN|nr:hypothetical protein [Glycomyces lechevalierae]MDA1385667.1 hypothetical protein [Glycomyces lechevalierae]MDR7339786.1 hypothetical protein [Glycomyces lechevalierae]
MAEPDDRDRRSHLERPQTYFQQQGQQVHGPQYNADRIEIHMSADADGWINGPSRQPNPVASRAEIERERARRQERDDLAYYGYRHYTRDRNRWLQTLTPQERAAEVQRDRDLPRHGGSRARHHRRILRSGDLPADTSPADPRYVQAKRKLESGQDRRSRLACIAAAVAMLLLVLIAISDGAYWFVAISVLAVIGGVFGYVRQKAPVKPSGPTR